MNAALHAVDGRVGRQGSHKRRTVENHNQRNNRCGDDGTVGGTAVGLHKTPDASALKLLAGDHRNHGVKGGLDGSEDDGLRRLAARRAVNRSHRTGHRGSNHKRGRRAQQRCHGEKNRLRLHNFSLRDRGRRTVLRKVQDVHLDLSSCLRRAMAA